jgi:hypothetical protein
MKKLPALLAALSLMILALTNSRVVFAANKVSLTPTSSSVSEGQSVTITIRLDQPIIATPPGNVVNLQIVSSNPLTTQISPSTVAYTAGEWAQPKNFTVTVPDNDVYGDSRNVLFTVTATSGSVYYNGYVAGASVYVTDMTPVPSYNPPGETPADDPYTYPLPPKDTVEDEPIVKNDPVATATTTPKDTTVVKAARTEQGLTESKVEQQNNTLFETSFFGYFSSTASASQKTVGYLVLALVTVLALLLPLLFLRRQRWLRRQRARHMRWMERNSKKAQTIPRRPSLKKTVKRPKNRRG